MASPEKKHLSQLALALQEKERDLREKQEELDAQRGMLNSAFEALALQNKSLENAIVEVNERNAELKQLLYQSSHGLRSPLTSIQGIFNLMQREPLTETLKEYKGHLDFKISSMLEILNSLTTLSTLINHEVKLNTVNIDALLDDCIRSCATMALKKNVNVVTVIEPQLKEIHSDGVLLMAVLKQVVMNALTFREPDKEGTVSIAIWCEESALVISVEDNGEGISPTTGNDIFKMFFRGSGRSGGSGLGLYIAKKGVDLLGGSITFTSTNDKTIFIVRIPVEEK